MTKAKWQQEGLEEAAAVASIATDKAAKEKAMADHAVSEALRLRDRTGSNHTAEAEVRKAMDTQARAEEAMRQAAEQEDAKKRIVVEGAADEMAAVKFAEVVEMRRKKRAMKQQKVDAGIAKQAEDEAAAKEAERAKAEAYVKRLSEEKDSAAASANSAEEKVKEMQRKLEESQRKAQEAERAVRKGKEESAAAKSTEASRATVEGKRPRAWPPLPPKVEPQLQSKEQELKRPLMHGGHGPPLPLMRN